VLSLISRLIAVLRVKLTQRLSPISSLRSKTQGRVAQLVEHSTLNRLVVGSIPTASTIQAPEYK
jgi:hypothetical protein